MNPVCRGRGARAAARARRCAGRARRDGCAADRASTATRRFRAKASFRRRSTSRGCAAIASAARCTSSCNNQVGFTTDPIDARSTHYASDPAKGFEIPIVHVNADDAEACIQAVRLGDRVSRASSTKDFLIDLVGYRRHGHNEADRAGVHAADAVQDHRASIRRRAQVLGARLVRERVVTRGRSRSGRQGVCRPSCSRSIRRCKKADALDSDDERRSRRPAPPAPSRDGGARRDARRAQRAAARAGRRAFKLHPTAAAHAARGVATRSTPADRLGARRSAGVRVAAAPTASACASPARTPSAARSRIGRRCCTTWRRARRTRRSPTCRRRAARSRSTTARCPRRRCWASSTASAPRRRDELVLWEAQYGDFANVAQPIIDQFISAGRAKWGQESGLVLLLPHGYEGQGPEHSSARLERFLQLVRRGQHGASRIRRRRRSTSTSCGARRCATTATPLVLMQPKSLLRLPAAASKLEELASGAFQPVIDDPSASQNRATSAAPRVLHGARCTTICSRRERPARTSRSCAWTSCIRGRATRSARSSTAIRTSRKWCGRRKSRRTWARGRYVSPQLRVSTGNMLTIRYIGRPERASPAEGYSKAHEEEQERIVARTLSARADDAAESARRSKV